MTRINKVLLAFLFLLSLIFFSAWRVLNSPYFGEIVSNRIGKIVEERFEGKVSFSKLDFSLIPLSMSLKNVKISRKDLFVSEVSSLKMSFTIWDFFKSDLRVDEIGISDGFIILNIDSKEEKTPKKIDINNINIFNQIDSPLKGKLPFEIGSIYLDSIDLELNETVYQIDKVVFSPYKNRYELLLSLKNIQIGQESLDLAMINLDISEKESRVLDMRLSKNFSVVSGKGKIDHKNRNRLNFKLNTVGSIPTFISDVIAVNGLVDVRLNVVGDPKNPKVGFVLDGKSIESPYANLDTVSVKGGYQNKVVSIESLKATKRQGEVELLTPTDINVEKFSLKNINARVSNLYSHDLLMFLGEDFKILRSRLTGDIRLSYIGEKFEVESVGDVELKGTKLGFSNDLIANESLILREFKLTNLPGMTTLNSKLIVDKYTLNAKGYISDKDIDIKLTAPLMELSTLGGEIGNAVSGYASLDVAFIGDLSDVKIKANGARIRDAKVMGYSLLNDTRFDLSYSFNSSELKIMNLYMKDNAEGKANGIINFEKETLKINIKLRSVLVENISKHITPVWETVRPYFQYASGAVDGKIELVGKFEDLKIRTLISSRRFYYLGESFKSFNADFSITNKKVLIQEILLRKKKGKISFSLNIEDSELKSTLLDIKNLNIRSLDNFKRFQFNYDGVLSGSFKSSLVKKKQEAKGSFILQRTSIGRKKLQPSVVTIDLKNDKISSLATVLGSRIKINSEIFIGPSNNKESFFNADININDLKTIFGILSVNNVYNTNISGDLSSKLRARFKLKDLDTIDLDFSLDRFFIRKGNKSIYLNKPGLISIQKSAVKNMDVEIAGNGGNYKLTGQGNKNSGYKINQEFALDLDFLTLFTGVLNQVEGRVYGRGSLEGTLDNIQNTHTINAERISFKVAGTDYQIGEGYLKSILNNSVWQIDKLGFRYGGGEITASGKSEIGFKFPIFEINMNAKDVAFSFLEKSSVLVNSRASLTGAKPPYSLVGNIFINGGRIEDEVTAFQGKKEYLKSVNKYINVKSEGITSLLDARFRIQSVEKVIVKNRLADLQMLGDVIVSGSLDSPKLEGEVKVVPETSRFKFKGNDFVIKTGLIYFDGNNESSGPGLNFESVAKINSYDVKMNITGDVENLQVNLESDPVLNKDDIFSLLTLGITQDFSKNLESKDRASLTTIGLGTLLVDQLKINEGLDSTLGLKLSVLPEISESEDSPIEASKLDSQSKVRTATKLRIQKKFSEDVDFTFSNTFGDDSEQKQEINMNFNLNKQWSVQGVFESENTTEDNQEEGSVGADIKYKWSF